MKTKKSPATPKSRIIINMFIEVPLRVQKKLGWPNFSRQEDWAVVHKTSKFELGFDFEEGYKFETKKGLAGVKAVLAYIREISKQMKKWIPGKAIHGMYTDSRDIKTVNAILEAAGFVYIKEQYSHIYQESL